MIYRYWGECIWNLIVIGGCIATMRYLLIPALIWCVRCMLAIWEEFGGSDCQ